MLLFEWDERKDVRNHRRHGISFEEARTVLDDEHGLLIDDLDHSKDEERFILLGLSEQLNTLVVCHCYRAGDEVIRIISARQANRTERGSYAARWR